MAGSKQWKRIKTTHTPFGSGRRLLFSSACRCVLLATANSRTVFWEVENSIRVCSLYRVKKGRLPSFDNEPSCLVADVNRSGKVGKIPSGFTSILNGKWKVWACVCGGEVVCFWFVSFCANSRQFLGGAVGSAGFESDGLYRVDIYGGVFSGDTLPHLCAIHTLVRCTGCVGLCCYSSIVVPFKWICCCLFWCVIQFKYLNNCRSFLNTHAHAAGNRFEVKGKRVSKDIILKASCCWNVLVWK